MYWVWGGRRSGERKAAELSRGLSWALSLGSWGLVQAAPGTGVSPLSPEFLEDSLSSRGGGGSGGTTVSVGE